MEFRNIVDIKGNTITLDPRSKIVITFSLVIGLAISIDYFQVFLYLILTIPMYLIYQPRREFLKRIPVALPFIILLSIFLYFSLSGHSVTISVPGYSRTYTNLEFIGLIAYRYVISVIYSYMLIYSEPSNVDIIEALSSFRLSQSLIAILMLINRIAGRIQGDYSIMISAARTKGVLTRGTLYVLFFKLRILSKILSKTVGYSSSLSDTLIARGFQGRFVQTTRNWTSEGMTIAVLSIIFLIMFTAIPWLR